MDIQLCPFCHTLPTVEIYKKGIRYQCDIFCNTFGCKLGWPLVTTGFNKEKTLKKASDLWDDAIEKCNQGIILI